MITTVTLNPCIDLTVRVSGLRLGELNLVTDTRTDISGKGVNVSVALRALGLATFCTGVSFDGNGRLLDEFLERNSICRQFAISRGSIRTNIKLYDEDGRLTEINHAGFPVDRVVMEQFQRILLECAAQSELVVFSGRIPVGVEPDIYRRSMMALKKLPVKCVVDAEGKPLREALRRKPYLVKPNRREMEGLLRGKIATREEALAACRRLLDKGVGVVCLSLGAEGALIAGREAAFYAPALDVPVRGLQGAGDSMVAGLCKGIKENAGLDDMLRYGVAAASASIQREGTLLCRKNDFENLLPRVKVERLDLPVPPPLPKPEKEAEPVSPNRSASRIKSKPKESVKP